jgi:hypothetical protein
VAVASAVARPLSIMRFLLWQDLWARLVVT